jgi:F420H(2)-dependent quinone reductase
VTDPAYRRPGWLRVKLINPLFRTLVLRAGLGRRGEQNLLRVLRVRGRRSGREHDVPMRIVVWQGRRYVVSLLGEAQWVRNLRAAGTAEVLTSTSTEPVVASEMQSAEKVAFLGWYCRQPARRLRLRTGLTVNPGELPPAELDRLARQHPVFRLDPAGDN